MKLHRRIIDIVSRLVPHRLRPDWKREWEAELGHRESHLATMKRPSRWDLLRRSSGSVWDALAMQPRRLEQDFYQDVHYGLRTMWRDKGWTLVVVLSLALGIGANTALFSFVDAALLRELPVEEPGELVLFEGTWGQDERPFTGYNGSIRSGDESDQVGTSLPYLTFEAFRDESETLDDVIAFASLSAAVQVDGAPGVVSAQVVSGNYYSALGVRAAAGRTFVADDDRPDAPATAVVSYDYWRRRFGLDPGVVGKNVVVNGVPVTIIGVSAEGFHGTQGFGTSADYSVPIALEPRMNPSDSELDQPWSWWLQIMGRMGRETTLAQVDAELEGVFQATAFETWNIRPPIDAEWQYPGLLVRSGSRGVRDVARGVIPLLSILTAVFGLLLLIVCVNIANLFLARGARRWREIGMRLAVGAGRVRLIRQLLTESFLLALVAGVLGIALAYWGKGAIAGVLQVIERDALVDLRIDFRVLAFVLLVSALTAMLFGLLPAFRHTRWSAAQSITTTSDRNPAAQSRFSRVLMVAQVAMSVVLLIGAGLFVRTLSNLRNVDVGFNAENLLLFRVDPTVLQYEEVRIAQLYEAMRVELGALPGVVRVTTSENPLVSNGGSFNFIFLEGRERIDDPYLVRIMRVDPGFLEAMQVPILGGRNLDEADTSGAPSVALVDETLADGLFADSDPLGRRFGFNTFNMVDFAADVEIVGLVPDIAVGGVKQQALPVVYIPRAQAPVERATFQLRTLADPLPLVPLIRDTVRGIDPNVPLLDIRTQEQQIEDGFAIELLIARVSAGFGIAALFLASIGLYGLMSHNVTSRVPEIGVRMALGARRGQLIRMIMWETSRMIFVGIAIGLPGAWAATRFIESFLYGLETTDAPTIAGAIGVLLTAGSVAAFLPARHAARVDPMVALRRE